MIKVKGWFVQSVEYDNTGKIAIFEFPEIVIDYIMHEDKPVKCEYKKKAYSATIFFDRDNSMPYAFRVMEFMK